MYCGHACLCLCMSVCVSVRGRTPTLLHGPGCNLGRGRGCPLVAHYWADLQSGHGLRCYAWQHNANPSYKLASIPPWRHNANGRLGGVCARCWPLTGGWRGVLKIARRICEVGVAGSPVIGRRRGRSQHYCDSLDCGLLLNACTVLALCLVLNSGCINTTVHLLYLQ